ncbi:MAG TPA: SpoIID/LytB domain-containing protein, partial [Elusimicrobiota bacterium]|nr:SpoIID/LytB domain-containing protein [Elusimicrobiota bacterium]
LVLEPIGRSRLDIIEQVKLDDYLYGVLPREMGSDWPIEALKAQAVVSRTYVLANRAPDPNHGYDLASDVSAQVYGGIEDEAPSALRAVDDTRGMILVDNQGRPVQAFFHSSCGGQTEMPQYVWNYTDTTAPFSSVKDTFCKDDPFAHWAIAVPVKTVQARLRRAGFRISNITAIKAAEKSPSGRVSKFLVTSSRGKARIGANQLRLAIGPEVMRSTLLTNLRLEKKLIFFEGRGWGHGVGLCQWGARGRALAGQNYDAILKAYYPQAQLVHGDPAS